MIFKKNFSTVFILFFMVCFSYGQIVRVACIGDSVTYGYGIENRQENCYPEQLQQLLGADYKVANFGYSGATMLKNGHKPYWEKEVFEKSKKFDPNIVIIHLGLNDQGKNNWPQHKDNFERDYLEMINLYKNLPSKPMVMICKMTPTFSGHHWFEEGMRENFQEIQSKIQKIAKKASVNIIDLHETLYRFPEYFSDNLHPTKEGARIIAQKVFKAITGNYGGLKLPILYGENMVIQRNEPISFEGTANFNETVIVKFNNQKKVIKANFDGNWSVKFDSEKAGGPYTLEFITSRKSIRINKVFVGEVWLASGQSNMDFKVRDMENGAKVLKDSLNSNVHLFSMDGKALSSDSFTKDDLMNCNAKDFFYNSGWSTSKANSLKNFSAIAYSFAHNLQKKLNIPVGIICNAIGGSPIQSWISRESMEKQHQTINLLNDTRLNPMVDHWVSERIELNMEIKSQNKIKSRHPYEPTFLFDAGITKIKDYNIRGVIWYQGESNAEQVELHSKLFKLLVRDWRFHFKNPELDFYFVQLSSLERHTWGRFRDSQRKLLEIPNTAMVVTLDIGHKTDVHPKKKWIIGERLSKVALNRNYNFLNEFSGPLLDFVNVKRGKLEVHFNHAKGLKTSNGDKVKDVFVANSDKIFVPAKTKIKNDKLIVWSKEIKSPRYVKYGYTPFTNGNLINKYHLPASTFSNLNN